MKTKYIGIESIFVKRKNLEATLACNIMLEGDFYSEPVYTNIFCHFVHLRLFLKLDNSDLAKRIALELETQIANSDKDIVQIDLPDFINKQVEWKFPTMVNLEISKDAGIPFQCYCLDIEEIRHSLELQNLLS